MRSALARPEARLQTVEAKLRGHHPAQRVEWLRARQAELERRLAAALERLLEQRRQAVKATAAKLHTVSPLATLERGYAIAVRGRDGKILRDSAEIAVGEPVKIRLAQGALIGRVLEKCETS